MGEAWYSKAKSVRNVHEHDLQRQVIALQAQLSTEAQSYRTIIATMAATCRSLQERIRVLEAERRQAPLMGRMRSATVAGEGRVHRKRRDPGVAGETAVTETTGQGRVVFDDAALLQKAWIWF